MLMSSNSAQASLIQYFKYEDGSTNWQYIANFSSGVLIILLSIAFVTLFFVFRRVKKANAQLQEMQNILEERVAERTQELRFSEAYIKDILDSMPLMLIGLDEDMCITQWNRLAEKITGIDSSKALKNDLWSMYPTITVSQDQVAAVFRDNKAVEIKHSQRGQYYFDINIYPLTAARERGVVILVHDVTQRILTENMLIQRDKMSAMGELASTMAHDINIPLQAITWKQFHQLLPMVERFH